jgi:hypothetical protein
MLQRADVIVHNDHCITTQQLALILSINNVTSFEIFDIQRYAQDGFVGASQSNTKLREKSFLPNCGHILKRRERPYCPGLLTVDETWSIILNQRQKGYLWNDTIISLPSMGKVISTDFVDVMLRQETVKSDA